MRKPLRNDSFSHADGGRLSDREFGSDQLLIGILQREKHLCVSNAEPPLGNVTLHLGMQFQQPQRIGYDRTALSDAPRNVFLTEREFLGEPPVCLRLFDWV